MNAPGDFLEASAVSPDAHVPGRFHADIPPSWNTPVGVHGGVILAVVGRAMEASLADADGRGLRTLHASFLDRPASGRLIVDSDIVRVGSSTAHLEAKVRSQGQDETTARIWGLFGRGREGIAEPYLDASPPTADPPDGIAPDPWSGPGVPARPPLFDHIDFRPLIGELPWSPNWEPGQEARYARWNRYHVSPDRTDGTLDPLALLPLADLPAAALWVKAGTPGGPFLAVVSLELTVHFLEPARSSWVLVDFRARWFGDGYVMTEADLWSDGRLVAVASQLMTVRARPLDG